MTKIKVCDIRSIEDAILCSTYGVDFIGIHQLYGSLSQQKCELISEIKLRQLLPKIVLVTKENNMETLIELCSQVYWDYVQIHRPISLLELRTLKNYLKEYDIKSNIICVIEAINSDTKLSKTIAGISDFVLFDTSFAGGTGQRYSDEILKNIANTYNTKRCFIAGGLNAHNVVKIINLCHPYCVDVQTGVESDYYKHRKDEHKLKEFVKNVKVVADIT